MYYDLIEETKLMNWDWYDEKGDYTNLMTDIREHFIFNKKIKRENNPLLEKA
jgi:hypothetical protein